jgi:hypothetical protein
MHRRRAPAPRHRADHDEPPANVTPPSTPTRLPARRRCRRAVPWSARSVPTRPPTRSDRRRRPPTRRDRAPRPGRAAGRCRGWPARTAGPGARSPRRSATRTPAVAVWPPRLQRRAAAEPATLIEHAVGRQVDLAVPERRGRRCSDAAVLYGPPAAASTSRRRLPGHVAQFFQSPSAAGRIRMGRPRSVHTVTHVIARQRQLGRERACRPPADGAVRRCGRIVSGVAQHGRSLHHASAELQPGRRRDASACMQCQARAVGRGRRGRPFGMLGARGCLGSHPRNGRGGGRAGMFCATERCAIAGGLRRPGETGYAEICRGRRTSR